MLPSNEPNPHVANTLDCAGPLSRRQFFRLVSLAAGGMGLSRLDQARAAARASGNVVPDTSVIFLWLPGGPPHMETYDMKPNAPSDYRGPYQPIATNVPGIDVCEFLPLHAQRAHRFSLIRSIAHQFADHGGGHKRFLTGRDPLSPVGFVNDYPAVGSMVAKMRENHGSGVPHYVSCTDPGREGIDVFSFGSAYLGPSTHPFSLGADPSQPDFQVRNLTLPTGQREILRDRLQLARRLDTLASNTDGQGVMDAMNVFRDRAANLLLGDEARVAFDLQREPRGLRERFGMHPWGQRCLLARRLVEAGASFVTMVLENPLPRGTPFPKDFTYNWDSHAVNCHIFTDTKLRLHYLDQAITALIDDLYTRGLDKKVLLVLTGEFGRTPRITYSNGRPGRDHWPQAMSVLISGGGLRMGQVVGSTNSKGEHPKDRPLTPNDLWALVLRHLGIDYHNIAFLDHAGRPMPMLPYGEPIAELI